MRWKVSTEFSPCMISEKSVLQAIVCSNKQMLQAACKRHGRKIDVEKTMHIEGIGDVSYGLTAALFGVSMFLSSVFAENAGIADGLESATFGCNLADNIMKEIETRIGKMIKAIYIRIAGQQEEQAQIFVAKTPLSILNKTWK